METQSVPYVLGFDNRIYYRRSQGWTELPGGGLGKDIGVGCNERTWVIGMGDCIHNHHSARGVWNVYPGGGQAVALAISSSGEAYTVGLNNHVYKANGTGWTELPGEMVGAEDIAVDDTGRSWVIGPLGHIFYLESSKWYEYPGGGTGTILAVSRDGIPYVTGRSDG